MYNPIRRLRDWFFETNIPTETRTYIDGNGNTITKQVKTRFAKGSFPKEEDFKDLLTTTFLKSVGNDLQDVSSTQEIYNETNIDKVVKPNQLPELYGKTEIVNLSPITGSTQEDYTGLIYNVQKENIGSKNKYSWNFTSTFLSWLKNKFVPKGGTANQVLVKNSNNNYDTKWETIIVPNGLPVLDGANKILVTDPTNTFSQWITKDYYTQGETSGLINSEITNRVNGDNNLQAQIDAIENGAILPTSSLQGLQTQINNIVSPVINDIPIIQLTSTSFQGGFATLKIKTYGKLAFFQFTGIIDSLPLQPFTSVIPLQYRNIILLLGGGTLSYFTGLLNNERAFSFRMLPSGACDIQSGSFNGGEELYCTGSYIIA